MALSENTQMFIDESLEHIESVEDILLKIEKDPSCITEENINFLYRAIHTVKGGASFLGFDKLIQVAHRLESIMSLVKENKISFDKSLIGIFLVGVDLINNTLNDIENHENVSIEIFMKSSELIVSKDNTKMKFHKNLYCIKNTLSDLQKDTGGDLLYFVKSFLFHGKILNSNISEIEKKLLNKKDFDNIAFQLIYSTDLSFEQLDQELAPSFELIKFSTMSQKMLEESYSKNA